MGLYGPDGSLARFTRAANGIHEVAEKLRAMKKTPTDQEVEAVARGIWEDCHGWFDERLQIGPDDMADTARAAIAALDQVRATPTS